MPYGEKPARRHVQPDPPASNNPAILMFSSNVSQESETAEALDTLTLGNMTSSLRTEDGVIAGVQLQDGHGLLPCLALVLDFKYRTHTGTNSSTMKLYLTKANSNIETVIPTFCKSQDFIHPTWTGSTTNHGVASIKLSYQPNPIFAQNVFSGASLGSLNRQAAALRALLRRPATIELHFDMTESSWVTFKDSLENKQHPLQQWFKEDSLHPIFILKQEDAFCLPVELRPRVVMQSQSTFPDIATYCLKMFLGLRHEIDVAINRKKGFDATVRLISVPHYRPMRFYGLLTTEHSRTNFQKGDKFTLTSQERPYSLDQNPLKGEIIGASKYFKPNEFDTSIILSKSKEDPTDEPHWVNDKCLHDTSFAHKNQIEIHEALRKHEPISCCVQPIDMQLENLLQQVDVIKDLWRKRNASTWLASPKAWRIKALLGNDVSGLPVHDFYSSLKDNIQIHEMDSFIQGAYECFRVSNHLPEFDPDQKALFSGIRTLPGGMAFVDGFPGTGKSTAMRAVLAPHLAAITKKKPAQIIVACALNSAINDLVFKLSADVNSLCKDPGHHPIIIRLHSRNTEMKFCRAWRSRKPGAHMFRNSANVESVKDVYESVLHSPYGVRDSRLQQPDFSAAAWMLRIAGVEYDGVVHPLADPEEWSRFRYHLKLSETKDPFDDRLGLDFEEQFQRLLAYTLSQADLVCCTVASLCRSILHEKVRARVVVIDECVKTFEQEMLPLFMHYDLIESIIGFGSTNQLGALLTSDVTPLYVDHKPIENPMSQQMAISFHERLMNAGFPTFYLHHTHRFENSLFQLMQLFENKLIASPLKEGQTVNCARAFMKKVLLDDSFESNVCMIGVESQAQKHGQSQVNYASAGVVLYVVEQLMIQGFEPSTVGIIVPYKAQSGLIRDELYRIRRELAQSSDAGVQGRAMNMDRILVNTIDAMQGQERDIFVFDFVTTSNASFLSYHRRLATSCSRAKTGLIMVCNPTKLDKARYRGEYDDWGDNLEEEKYLLHRVIHYCKWNGLFKLAQPEWIRHVEPLEENKPKRKQKGKQLVLRTRSDSAW